MHSLLHRDLPHFPWFSVLIGAVCNIVLDPVFIFVFHMGVRGAALATVISQAIFHTLGSFIPLRQKDTASPQEKASPPGGKGRSSLYRAGTCCFICSQAKVL